MEKKVFNLMIVDESGSMSIIRKQAFNGLNETIKTVEEMQKKFPEMEQRITLMTFDSGHKKFIYDDVSAQDTHELAWSDYRPGGATPLYDAIGMSVAKLNAVVGKDDNVLVTIITDGEENCSEEYNLKMIKNLIEKLKEQNWTFTLIGADSLDVEGLAHSMAIEEHMSWTEDEKGTEAMFERERNARRCYNECVCSEKVMKKGKFFTDEENEE